MKNAFSKECKRRLKLALKSKINGKNRIMEINTWVVARITYSGSKIDWKSDEFSEK